jgi:hypothetical protein
VLTGSTLVATYLEKNTVAIGVMIIAVQNTIAEKFFIAGLCFVK